MLCEADKEGCFKVEHVDILEIFRGPIWVEIVFKYKFNTILRQVYPTIKFEFCAAMKNEGLMEKLVHFLIGLFRDTVPQLFHKCPFFKGLLDMFNISIDTESLPVSKILVSGIYRAVIVISIQTSKLMLVDVELEANTPIKDI